MSRKASRVGRIKSLRKQYEAWERRRKRKEELKSEDGGKREGTAATSEEAK